jgi:PAS domain S-box-containing protein
LRLEGWRKIGNIAALRRRNISAFRVMASPATITSERVAAPAAVSRWLITGAALIVCLILGMAGWSVYTAGEYQRELTRVRTQNIAKLLDNYIAGVFDKADLALKTLTFEYQYDLMFRRGNQDAILRQLAYQLRQRPELENLFIAGADGTVLRGNERSGDLSVAGRAYFRALRDGTGGEPVISEPLTSQSSGRMTLVIARRLNRPDGAFAGIVAAAIAAEHFSATFATLDLGAQAVVSLRMADLALVALHADLTQTEPAPGSTVVPPQFAAALRANSAGGSFVARDAPDGAERASTYRRVARYPLYVTVGISTAVPRIAARSNAFGFVALALLAVVFTVLLAFFLHLEWRRRDAAAAALAAESSRNQLLLHHASDAVHIIDAEGEGRVLEASNSFCAMLGRTRAEVLRMNLRQWCAQEGGADPLEEMRDLLVTRDNTIFPARYRRQDGTVIDVEVNVATVTFNGRPALFCSARDIAGRIAAARELLQSERRLSLAADAGGVGIWEVDLVTGRAWRSPRCARIFGYATGRRHWTREQLLAHVIPEAREFVTRQLAQAAAGGFVQFECRILRADRAERWIAVKGEVFRDAGAAAVSMMGTVIDVTERKRDEQQIRALNETLEQRVAERTSELNRAHAELRALTAAQESFQEEERTRIARELHDELAQKLTVLKLQLHVLRTTLAAAGFDAGRKLEDMNLLLTETMTAVRQIAVRMRPPILDELGLAPALRDLANDFSRRTGIACELTVDPETMEFGNRLASQLYRMAQEALTNVARHAQASTVTVRLYEDRFGKITLSVQDNGKGMNEHQQRNAKSFGLIGMRERVALLGGTLEIRSAPGAGTAVEVVIPQAARRSARSIAVRA